MSLGSSQILIRKATTFILFVLICFASVICMTVLTPLHPIPRDRHRLIRLFMYDWMIWREELIITMKNSPSTLLWLFNTTINTMNQHSKSIYIASTIYLFLQSPLGSYLLYEAFHTTFQLDYFNKLFFWNNENYSEMPELESYEVSEGNINDNINDNNNNNINNNNNNNNDDNNNNNNNGDDNHINNRNDDIDNNINNTVIINNHSNGSGVKKEESKESIEEDELPDDLLVYDEIFGVLPFEILKNLREKPKRALSNTTSSANAPTTPTPTSISTRSSLNNNNYKNKANIPPVRFRNKENKIK